MIIICSGMVRSASTWSYNVCRLLLKASSRDYWSGYVGEGKAVDKYVEDALSKEQDILLKSHSPGKLTLELIQSKVAKNIFTYRDPRDSICSRIEFLDSPFLIALRGSIGNLRMFDWYKDNGNTLFIRFDCIVQEPLQEVKRVAKYLNLELDESKYSEICEETSLENSRKISEQVERMEPRQVFYAASHTIDRETLLHSGHVGLAKNQRWQEELSPEQKLIANSMLKPWLLKLNYETESSFEQMYAELMKSTDWQGQAQQYLDTQNYAEAASLYQRAIELQPEVKAHYWRLGLVFLLQGLEQVAKETWWQALAECELDHAEASIQELIEILQIEAKRRDELQDCQSAALLWQCIEEITQNT